MTWSRVMPRSAPWAAPGQLRAAPLPHQCWVPPEVHRVSGQNRAAVGQWSGEEVAVQSVGFGAELLILFSGSDGADLPRRWIWAQANLQFAATAGAP
jgi:hypothetical protein